MTLKDTCKHLRSLLEAVCSDLDKSEKGNKAASQRVRTGTIKLEKIAKLYRKESVKSERGGGGGGKKKKAAAAPKKKPAKKAPAKKAAKKASPVKKAASKSSKKATAKLPKKKSEKK